MNIIERGQNVIALEISELQRLSARLDKRFVEAVELLKSAVDAGRKIVIVGVGKSGNLAHKVAATLNSTGATAVVLNPQNALHGDIGMLDSGDVIMAFSQSGETREMMDLLPHLKRLDVKIIALTGAIRSTLAKHSDCVLDTTVEREACPLNLAPTSSTTVMLVLSDALVMALLEERGFQSEHFAELHPGGTLGRALLTKVSDIMRGDERLPLVIANVSVEQTLDHMTKCRSGVAVVVDDEGKVEGVFTHGDFVRAFQSEPGVGSQPVSSYMTGNPIRIDGSRLATEALKIFNEHQIDDLVVVDKDDRPIGVLDSQDLGRVDLV